MKSNLILGTLALAVCAFLPQKAPAQKQGKTFDAPPQHYALIARYPAMDGEVRVITGAELTLRVKFTHPPPNAKSNSPRVNANRNRRMSPQQRLVQMQLTQLRAANNFHLESDYIDFYLPLAEKLVVRSLVASIEYGDRGHLIQEKPDPKSKHPGRPAEFSDLVAGAYVRIQFAPAKTGDYRPSSHGLDRAILTRFVSHQGEEEITSSWRSGAHCRHSR